MIILYIKQIITNYNEEGFFIAYDQYVYWCNGKRFEKWCQIDSPGCTYKLILNVLMSSSGKAFQHKKWATMSSLDFNDIEIVDNRFICKTNGVGREIQVTLIDNTIVTIPCKLFKGHGMIIKAYQSSLYYFGSTNNERFDFRQGKWIEFKSNPRCWPQFQISLFHNLFYYFCYSKMFVYDPNLDIWEDVTIEIP